VIARKPLGIEVSNTSRMIVPPVQPDADDLKDWAAGTAVAVGAMIEVAGRRYWCTVAGTTGSAAPTHTDGDAADGTATWRWIRPVRSRVWIVNDSSVVIYLAFVSPAVANAGIRLNAAGGAFNSPENWACPRGGVWAIGASAGSNNLTIQEG